jgi:hypothetical protein
MLIRAGNVNRFPKTIYVGGSTNGTTWTLVNSQFAGAAQADADTPTIFTVSNSGYYTYYRFIINQTNGGNVVNLRQVNMTGNVLSAI